MAGVSPAVWLVICLVVVAGMLFGFLGRRGQARRALSRQADLRGWIYKGSKIALTRQWPGEPFVAGARQEAHNIVTGQVDGTPFTSFEYEVAQNSEGPLAHVHVIAIPVPDAAASAALPSSPTAVDSAWQARQCGHDIVAWRDGAQDMDAVEPAVRALLAWAGATGAVTPGSSPDAEPTQTDAS